MAYTAGERSGDSPASRPDPEEPMTTTSEGGGFTRTALFVLVSLFVTVVGGLLVEYLKPKQSFTTPTGAATNAAPAAPLPTAAPPAPRGAEIQNLLVKKWNAAETPQLFGDVRVAFTPYGQVVRTYYRQLIGETVTTHPYQVAADGTLSSDAATNLRLVHVSNDELVLSWDGAVVQYKRAWYWWEIALAVAGGVLLLAIIAVAQQAGKK